MISLNAISENGHRIRTTNEEMKFDESHCNKEFLYLDEDEQKEDEFFRDMTILLEKPV
jgi:hypothetical protein